MNDLERMYRQLVRTIRANFPQYLAQPFEVGELYSTILPYRLHRRELGLETNQDYEMTLMEMLAGAQGYLIVDEKMRDVLGAEHVAASPDTARLREFASSHVALAPEALQRLEGGYRVPDPRSSSGSTVSRAAVRMSSANVAGTSTPSSGSSTSASGETGRPMPRPVTIAEAGEPCAFCKGALPPGRTISFCPHCGHDLTIVHCPACGTELERGWKYCVTCGRGAEPMS